MKQSVQQLYRILEDWWGNILQNGIPAGALRDQVRGGAQGVLPPTGNTGSGYSPVDHNHTASGDGGVLTNDAHDGYSVYQEIVAPSGPAANTLRLYSKDKTGVTELFYKNSSGTERDLSTVGTSSNSSLHWFNVLDYGAVGDGSTDDTSAVSSAITALVSAGRGVLYFPAGTYKTSGGFTLSVPCMVLGDGESGADTSGSAYHSSKVTCTSSTAVLFLVTAGQVTFARIGLENTAGSTPTAGAGIRAAHASDANARVSYDSITVRRFWIDIDSQAGVAWSMDNCTIGDAVKYGVKVQNTISADTGDWMISNTVFASTLACDASIRMESSGGGKITNCKFNGGGSGSRAVRHIDLSDVSTTPGTSILLVSNSSFENYSGDAIHLLGPNWTQIVIHGCQFGQYSNTSGSAIDASTLTDLVIDACHFRAGSGAPSAITLTSITRAYIGAMTNDSFTARVTQTSCTGVIDASTGAGGTAGGDLTGTYPNPTIASDAVSYAKMQNVSATSRLLGRASSGAGDVEEITIGSGLSLAGTTLSASSGSGALDDLTDVTITTPATADRLRYDGSVWRNSPKVWQPLTDGASNFIFASGDVVMCEV